MKLICHGLNIGRQREQSHFEKADNIGARINSWKLKLYHKVTVKTRQTFTLKISFWI